MGPNYFFHFSDQRHDQPWCSRGLGHDEYVALVRGVQNPKVQISSALNRLRLEDNVPFFVVEFTVEDIVITYHHILCVMMHAKLFRKDNEVCTRTANVGVQ